MVVLPIASVNVKEAVIVADGKIAAVDTPLKTQTDRTSSKALRENL